MLAFFCLSFSSDAASVMAPRKSQPVSALVALLSARFSAPLSDESGANTRVCGPAHKIVAESVEESALISVVACALAASKRVGETSLAPIEADASSTIATLCPPRDNTRSAGRTKASTAMRTNKSCNHIKSEERNFCHGAFACKSRMALSHNKFDGTIRSLRLSRRI